MRTRPASRLNCARSGSADSESELYGRGPQAGARASAKINAASLSCNRAVTTQAYHGARLPDRLTTVVPSDQPFRPAVSVATRGQRIADRGSRSASAALVADSPFETLRQAPMSPQRKCCAE